MTRDEAREVVRKVLHQVAPEADLGVVGAGETLQEALDLDSVDFLDFVAGLHEETGVEIPEGVNVVVGQAHFVKTVEDLHEALACTGSHLRFGIGFCEASGPCLVRRSGNERDLVDLAARNAEAIGAGHCFVVYLKGGFPLSVLNAVKAVPEVCTVFCATANQVEVLVAQTDLGRGVVGVVDGLPPAGLEGPADEADRRQFLRAIGYKL